MDDRPLSQRLCDKAVLAFAGWTLLCHLVVCFGGSLHVLLLATLVASAALAVSWRRVRGMLGNGAHAAADSEDKERLFRARLMATAAPAALLALAPLLELRPAAIWWLAVLYLSGALWMSSRNGSTLPAPHASRLWERSLWILGLGAALLAFLAHDYSPDDSFYVNLAVAAVDSPSAALLAHDTIHGIPDLPLLLSAYKVCSFELLAGALAYLTRMPAIEVCHWVLPPIFALLGVLAYARLMRLLTPRIWIFSLAAALAVLLLVGESAQFHSSFAFWRIHQGKAVFLTVLVPLLIVYAVEHAQAPTRRSFLRLFAAQLAAIGTSATALWAAPVVAALALLASVRRSRLGARAFFTGLLASSYVLVAGLLLWSASRHQAQAESWLPGRVPFPESGDEILKAVWSMVFGTGPVAIVCLFAMLGGWCFCRTRIARRVALVFPLGVLLVFFNPYTGAWIAANVTGLSTYWRAFWPLPIVALLAIVVTSPIALPRPRPTAMFRMGVAVLLTVSLVLVAPRQHAARPVPFRPIPSLKVPGSDYEIAKKIVDLAPPRSFVLAPVKVSAWIPTFHEHPYPIVARQHYLEILAERMDPEHHDLRLRLHDYASGKQGPRNAAARLARGIRRFDLSCVAFFAETIWSGELRDTLLREEFELAATVEHHERGSCEIWLRRAEPTGL